MITQLNYIINFIVINFLFYIHSSQIHMKIINFPHTQSIQHFPGVYRWKWQVSDNGSTTISSTNKAFTIMPITGQWSCRLEHTLRFKFWVEQYFLKPLKVLYSAQTKFCLQRMIITIEFIENGVKINVLNII